MTDIIDLIDQATGCQTCGGALGDSPSGDFCKPLCQQRWHETRAELFEGYESAEHEGFDGLGWLFERVLRPSQPGDGPPYVHTVRSHPDGPSFTVMSSSEQAAWFPASCDEFDMIILYGGSRQAMAAAMRQVAIDSARGLPEVIGTDQLPTDPRERALELRRRRNTGPQQRQRAPRRINPRGYL